MLIPRFSVSRWRSGALSFYKKTLKPVSFIQEHLLTSVDTASHVIVYQIELKWINLYN